MKTFSSFIFILITLLLVAIPSHANQSCNVLLNNGSEQAQQRYIISVPQPLNFKEWFENLNGVPIINLLDTELPRHALISIRNLEVSQLRNLLLQHFSVDPVIQYQEGEVSQTVKGQYILSASQAFDFTEWFENLSGVVIVKLVANTLKRRVRVSTDLETASQLLGLLPGGSRMEPIIQHELQD